MKKNNVLKLAAIASVVALAGCSTVPTLTSVSQKQQGALTKSVNGEDQKIKVLSCSVPVKTISLAPLQCKSAACQSTNQGTGNFAALIALANQQEGIPDLSGFGDGMTDMLTSSLASTGCFDLLDRELLAELAREQEFSGKKVNMQGADMMATGSITSLTYDKSKSGFGGGFLPVIGGVTSSKVTAKIGMDVRVIDVNTGRVSYTRTYNAESGKRSYGFAGGGLIGGGLIGGGHSVKGGIEMEEAAREIIQNVTNDMIEKLVPVGGYSTQYLDVNNG